MFYILPANPKFMSFLKLAAICAAGALVGLWLSASPVKAADQYGSFNEAGEYRYYQPGSSLRPSIGQPDYDLYHRQQELTDRQAEQWRQEALRQEQRSQSYGAPPAVSSDPYNSGYSVITPQGTLLCRRSFQNIICQ